MASDYCNFNYSLDRSAYPNRGGGRGILKKTGGNTDGARVDHNRAGLYRHRRMENVFRKISGALNRLSLLFGG